MAGTVVGTPQFMSPEQATGRLDLLGPASDVYSLGATLYCLLTGQPPFSRRARTAWARCCARWSEATFPRRGRSKPELPAALEAVCLKAMARRPEDRYASVEALARDVRQWLADEPVAAYAEPLRVRAGRWAAPQTPGGGGRDGRNRGHPARRRGAWWIQQQRTAAAAREREIDQAEEVRRQTIEEKARLALERARGRFDEGWRTHNLARLNEARDDAARAVEVADSGASEETREQAVRFRTEVEGRIGRARKNNALLAALLDISAPRETATYAQGPSGQMMRLAQPSIAQQYAIAFRNWDRDLDVDRGSEESVVARFQDQPEPVVQEVVAGLDRWMRERREKKHPRPSGGGCFGSPTTWTATARAGSCGRC